MPVYEYICDDCHTRDTLHRAMEQRDDAALCPRCGQPMRRVFGVFRYRFRPRGWTAYEPDGAEGTEMVHESFVDGEGRLIADPRL